MDYRWLGPELARAQENTEADKDPAIAQSAGELFDTLRAWSLAQKVEAKAHAALRSQLEALRKKLAGSPAPQSFATELLDIAERALAKA